MNNNRINNNKNRKRKREVGLVVLARHTTVWFDKRTV